MSNQCIKDLRDQEILDMELEKLSFIFLRDFFQHGDGSIINFIYHCKNNRDNIDEPLYEAYQWLYNKGYITKYLVRNDDYFVSRSGQKFLDSSKS